MLPTNSLLEKTELLFKNVRTSVMEAAAALHEVEQSKAWQERYSTWKEFVEQGCGVSQGFASKLLKSFRYYVIEAGFTKEEIADIDSEKLYLSLALPGNDEQRIAKAKSLSRQELKAELHETKEGEHECVPITICQKCGKRL